MWGTIRKFGPEHCELPTMVWNVAILLRLLTLNIDERNKKPIPNIFYIFMLIISTFYFYVYLFSMAWFVFVRCQETGDLLAAIIVFSLGIASEIGTVKLVYMFINRKAVAKLVTELLSFDSLIPPGSRYSKNILKTLRRVKKRAIIFWSVIMINGVIYILKGVLTPGRHFMEDHLILYGFEPMYESPNYEIAFTMMVFAVFFSVYLPASISTFLIIITGYIEAQTLALSEEVSNLWPDAKKHYLTTTNVAFDTAQPSFADNDTDQREAMINKYVNKRLKEIIKNHTRLINLVTQIESVFRGAILLEFIVLIVSLIAELLGGLENTYMEIPFALMQVGMDCFTGQRVMDASDIFFVNVYDCKWENFDKHNMKLVLLMMQSSQKTLTLSAGGITMLSFRCFMSVIKSVYSAYTTLRSTMN